jgi:uncharacterized protein involved in high-affinity Fe2+ transport
MRLFWMAAAAVATAATPALAAQEFYVGEPVVKEHLQIVPNYLTGIEMNAHPPGMEMGPDSIHLEADVHAAADEAHSLPEDTWIPYLTISYDLTKTGSPFHKTGKLAAMVAKDGLHYANGVKMAGPGTYHLTYVISPPALYRHADKATGVPDWWKPIKADWTFQYPSKTK